MWKDLIILLLLAYIAVSHYGAAVVVAKLKAVGVDIIGEIQKLRGNS